MQTRESLLRLPVGLPVPTDDGVADHLPGRAMPIARLRSTEGSDLHLTDLPMGRSVVFVYPRTGRPGHPLPSGWDGIPGARGCTTELCSIRDALDDLRAAGAVGVYGLSTQDAAYQSEAVRRLGLTYPLLADPTRQVGRALDLPAFTVGGLTLYRRLTIVVQDGVIEHVFYPVYPPDTHVADVTGWLSSRRW
ncbi:MAG: peroxiredoxin [Intrasporangiaceae bacterium]|nr:peroxiredoxin [Intrasporangiaceae bacterium]